MSETGRTSWFDLLERGRRGEKVGGSIDTKLGIVRVRWVERSNRSKAASKEAHNREGHAFYAFKPKALNSAGKLR